MRDRLRRLAHVQGVQHVFPHEAQHDFAAHGSSQETAQSAGPWVPLARHHPGPEAMPGAKPRCQQTVKGDRIRPPLPTQGAT
jgi:hypothetical protein